MENKVYKRVSRHPSDETKRKISSTMKGRAKTDAHKKNISSGLVQYWGNSDNFPADNVRHEGTGNGYIETGNIV